MTQAGPSIQEAAAVRDLLKPWLLDQAFPLWWTVGADHALGGFHEKIGRDGRAIDAPRRGRVLPRQIYAFCRAGALGWNGPWREAVEHGCEFLLRAYRRPDGLVRTLVAPGGAPLDDTADLYDQAFALLAFAHAFAAGVRAEECGAAAHALRVSLEIRLGDGSGGFREQETGPLRNSNSHMHLFEALLAWVEIDPDPEWRALTRRLGRMAVEVFVDPTTGAVREAFDEAWRPKPEAPVEPGHQFEWSWLLTRWSGLEGCEAPPAAHRLFEIGEAHGVDPASGTTLDALDGALSPVLRTGRLWPQTERLKAAAQRGAVYGEAAAWRAAAQAGRVLLTYFEDVPAGAWRDRRRPDGGFVDEPSPASSLYHIVCAVEVLDQSLREAGAD
ncbi:MAG TPA: AGE family epimerase/isomerase [Caulobacteraceae bacterium]|jgi:mannose-6-phosphate isomerase